MSEPDYAVDSEAVPQERARREALVRSRFKQCGLHLYPPAYAEAMVGLIEDECVALRKRFALLLDSTIEYYGGELTRTQVERLAVVLLAHYISPSGEIKLPTDLTED